MITNMNFRRKLKYLKKDIQRCGGSIEKTNVLLDQFKKETGLDIEHECYLPELLKFNIPSRILSRISKAAKKRNYVVDAKEFIATYKFKNSTKFPSSLYYPKFDWHQIPFKRTKRILVESKHVEEHFVYVINGKEIIKSKTIIKPEFDRVETEIS
jgi:hypothetical protein